jgi:peptide deformylase
LALLEILEYPDERLRRVAKPVKQFDEYINQIVADMLETMYHAQGAGLAATQVDIDKRIVVIDISETRDQPLVLINPSYKAVGDTRSELPEGCLSVPGFYDSLGRYDHIILTASDVNGNLYTKECTGIMAVCVQHEIDHLDGKLLIDEISVLKKQRFEKKLTKIRKMQERAR